MVSLHRYQSLSHFSGFQNRCRAQLKVKRLRFQFRIRSRLRGNDRKRVSGPRLRGDERKRVSEFGLWAKQKWRVSGVKRKLRITWTEARPKAELGTRISFGFYSSIFNSDILVKCFLLIVQSLKPLVIAVAAINISWISIILFCFLNDLIIWLAFPTSNSLIGIIVILEKISFQNPSVSVFTPTSISSFVITEMQKS